MDFIFPKSGQRATKQRINCYFCSLISAVSSVGLEHRLDRAGVVGSNPSNPTTNFKNIDENQ